MVFGLIKMEINMKDNSKKIKNKEKVYSNGQTGIFIKEIFVMI